VRAGRPCCRCKWRRAQRRRARRRAAAGRLAQIGQRLALETHHGVGVAIAQAELGHQPAALLAVLGQAAAGQHCVQFGQGLAGLGLDVSQLRAQRKALGSAMGSP
jgi:hypothetical protein